MSFGSYLSARAASLCAAGIGGLYLLLVLLLVHTPVSLILLLLLSGGLVLLCTLATGWRRTDKRLRDLRARLWAMPDKYLIGETLERPRDAVALEYYFLMQEISRSAIGAVEQAKAEKQDYCEYVEQWVHEIKTPLTACSLILANHGEPAKLRRELRRADNLTETILAYARLRTAEKDTQITTASLRTLCAQAVQAEMELLIAAGIGVTVEGEGSVYTDAKLLIFILKQLLINCAKYCPGCQIRIALEARALTLEDNGPGIPAHELPRVTERGFTGAAWRTGGQSTGMGLYIVRELCQRLDISMEIESEEGQFTRFRFQFPGSCVPKDMRILQNC